MWKHQKACLGFCFEGKEEDCEWAVGIDMVVHRDCVCAPGKMRKDNLRVAAKTSAEEEESNNVDQ